MPKVSRAFPALVLALSAVYAGAEPAAFRATHVGDPQNPSLHAYFSGLSHDGETMLVTVIDSGGSTPSFVYRDGTIAPVPNIGTNAGNYLFRLSGDGRTVMGSIDGFGTSWTNGGTGQRLSDGGGMMGSIVETSSFDGTAFVGTGFFAGGVSRLLWSGSSYTVLDRGGAVNDSVADLSDDGRVAVGAIFRPGSSFGIPSACTWNTFGVRTDLDFPPVNAGDASFAIAVSANGNVVLGNRNSDYGGSSMTSNATLWVGGVLRDLGSIPGVMGDEYARALSADGSVAGGTVADPALNFLVGRPFLWDAFHGMRDLRLVLLSHGLGPELQGWTLEDVQSLSVLPSGATLVGGSAIDPNGIEQAYVATIPAEAGFDALGDLDGGPEDSIATGISRDGGTVIGYGHVAAGKRAFVWTRDRGMFDIGTAAQEARGVSADGRLVAGVQAASGFVWKELSGGRWLGTGAQANAISANGYGTVGSAIGPDGIRHAYRWNGPSTERYKTYIGSHVAPSEALGCNADASLFVGSTTPHTFGGVTYLARAVGWDFAGRQKYLGDLPGGRVESVATAVSDDGTIVGWSSSANGPEAFVYDPSTGRMRGLGDLPGYGFASRATAISAGSEVIVGVGVQSGQNHAFVYDTAARRMYDLKDVLIAQGAVELAAWILSEATGVTRDPGTGRVSVSGYGIDPNGRRQAFRATIPNFVTVPVLRP